MFFVLYFCQKYIKMANNLSSGVSYNKTFLVMDKLIPIQSLAGFIHHELLILENSIKTTIKYVLQSNTSWLEIGYDESKLFRNRRISINLYSASQKKGKIKMKQLLKSLYLKCKVLSIFNRMGPKSDVEVNCQ